MESSDIIHDDAVAVADQLQRLAREISQGPLELQYASMLSFLLESPSLIASKMEEGEEAEARELADRAVEMVRGLTARHPGTYIVFAYEEWEPAAGAEDIVSVHHGVHSQVGIDLVNMAALMASTNHRKNMAHVYDVKAQEIITRYDNGRKLA